MQNENHASPSASTTKPKKKKGGFFKGLFFFVVFLALVGAIAWGAWSYKLYLDTKQQLTQLTSLEGQQELAQQEIQRVVDQLGQHIMLPENEEPLMATIVDAAALAEEQPFYQGASDGDKIVIYPEAQKAILFSQEKDLIINVGPVFLEEDQAAGETVEQPAEESTDFLVEPADDVVEQDVAEAAEEAAESTDAQTLEE